MSQSLSRLHFVTQAVPTQAYPSAQSVVIMAGQEPMPLQLAATIAVFLSMHAAARQGVLLGATVQAPEVHVPVFPQTSPAVTGHVVPQHTLPTQWPELHCRSIVQPSPLPFFVHVPLAVEVAPTQVKLAAQSAVVAQDVLQVIIVESQA